LLTVASEAGTGCVSNISRKKKVFPSRNIQTGPAVSLAPYSVGTGVLSREYSDRNVRLTTHLHLEKELLEVYL
jgi:hypothetical protein